MHICRLLNIIKRCMSTRVRKRAPPAMLIRQTDEVGLVLYIIEPDELRVWVILSLRVLY